jgi:hypothetical protein
MDISALKTPYYGNGISTNFCAKKLYFHCPREKDCGNAPFPLRLDDSIL